MIGAGVNGRAAARTFLARGRPRGDLGRRRGARAAAPRTLGAEVAASLEEALAADLVVTVTPGHEVLFAEGSLAPGQHVSLMGADGPGKAEIARPSSRVRTSSATTGSRRATAASSRTPSRRVSSTRDDVTDARRGARRDRRGPRRRRRDHRVRLDRARDPGSRDRARRRRAAGELLDLPRLEL